MEFGLFLQGYVPGPGAHDPDAEHEALLREAALVELADKTGWKYAWFSEHHALTEYSHISSSEVMMGYLFRGTERIHLGSGIFNLSPRVNHPVRNAERVTMLDQLSSGRFELGTGRGAGSHEVATFNIHDTSSTKSEWDEVIWELRKMWETEDYTFQGQHFQLDTPHNILPKPYKGMHPPIWVACGNPPTFEKAGKMGIGALGFNFSPIHDMKPMIDAYKQGIADCTEPVGRYINDNIMVTNAVLCFEDGNKARDLAAEPDRGYLYTLVCLYHDTFPKPDWAPVWPEPPIKLDREGVERVIDMGGLLCGTPDEVCEQLKSYEQTGVDQVAFGFPSHLSHDDAMECIELFGTKVIPEFDKDPVHSTTRYRDAARVQ
ncbi:MAG TPA: LLM class flavin-dependent oxidoreductase [Acidimicrobiales bacterium]|nr:LLM class flavin-dependent oxidoreductase [Acidimicrobiales bacterium]